MVKGSNPVSVTIKTLSVREAWETASGNPTPWKNAKSLSTAPAMLKFEYLMQLVSNRI